MSVRRISRREYMAKARERSAGTVRQRSPLRLHGLIRSGIRLGLLSSREQLVENHLVDVYSTSRNAVREAMSVLADEGLVARSPGRGTVVVGRIHELAMDDFSREQDSDHEYVSILIEQARVPVTPLLRQRLRTDGPSVWLAEWLTLRDGEPLCIGTRYSLGCRMRELGTDASAPDLPVRFRSAYGRELGQIRTTVESLTCDERTGRVLGVEPGSPLLLRERLLLDSDGVPWEWNHTFFPGARVSLRTVTDVAPPSA